jgi:cytochrome c biogenesis protein CcmG, thiol:disulfide interchange protein DsbE
MNLSKNEKIEIIGLNYKDKFKNADKFINKLGNPYTKILIDRDGTKAIELGAFGVPETFLIYKNQIIKKFIGPLNSKLIKEIEIIIK